MSEPMSDAAPARSELETLRLVVEGTASETGTEFFQSLVRNLAESLGISGAWVTEYLPEEGKLRALAMWMNGGFVDDYEYSIRGTPCEPVVEQRSLVHFPDRVIELFGDDANELKAMNAVSFMGKPLLDQEGAVLGHLAVLDSKPMPEDPRTISLFEIFASRAAAEHRRLKAEQRTQASEEQLSLLIESAMDAILVLDSGLKIARANRTAERLFGCRAEDLIGEGIHDFLVPDSAARVERFASEIEQRPDGRQQLWVPQDFVARRWDHSVFPGEATLSRFETRGAAYYTLILRNVDERLEAERQIQMLTQEADYLREAVRDIPGQGDLLGQSDAMRAVAGAIRQVAPTGSTVIITGETGTGKELVARSIHRASRRSAKPLIIVNCAAVPANLIESEFFGHEKGAFTGAVNRREGRFSLADGGTIFLDEIGELPLELQAKLLRVLQEGEFEPLGSTTTRKVDVRVLAATNRDLKRMVAAGDFREDLYFRLNVFPLQIPALRDRARDVELLAASFAQRFARRMGKRVGPLTAGHLKTLRTYRWPGNVRELQNVIERAIILTSGPEFQLDRAMCGMEGAGPVAPMRDPDGPARILTAQEVTEMERANLYRALESCGWRISGENGAARLLGIPASTLSSRAKALGVRRPGS